MEKILSPNYIRRHEEARRRIRLDPSIITSHTVIVVDMSGSMKKSDMNGHRTRSRGVYYNLAEEFVSGAIPPPESGIFTGGATTFTDVVTLIEMRDYATIEFYQEPISWLVYNKFVQLAERKDCRGHGNYESAVVEAFGILDRHVHDKVALCLFFFSDGRPSDPSTGAIGFPSNMLNLIRAKCGEFGDRLTFSTFGFGSNAAEFDILYDMVRNAKLAGAKASCKLSYHDDIALATALSEARSTLTETRTMLSRLNVGVTEEKRVRVHALKDSLNKKDSFVYNPTNWSIFQPGPSISVRRLELKWVPVNKNGKEQFQVEWQETPFLHARATSFAVSKAYFGEGAERIVFLMSEIDRANMPVGVPLVAKESLYQHKRQDLKYLRRWHKTFVKTQLIAEKLAKKFNQRLDDHGISSFIPRIQFLPCSVYEVEQGDQQYAYLSEHRLNPDNYWKWNNNTGGIDGIARVNFADFERVHRGEDEVIHKKGMEVIAEGDEDEDDSDEEDIEEKEEGKSELQGAVQHGSQSLLESRILETDVPQAFSHFTYRFTKRSKLVCDLQGELTFCVETKAPVFKLTDPCIHSSTKTYGHTDRGKKGMAEFFKTHQCNAVCKILQIDNGSQRD
jgi:hypothetical protein